VLAPGTPLTDGFTVVTVPFMPGRVRAILGFKRNNIPVVLARSKTIYNGLHGSPGLYPAPNPPLVTFLSQIQSLDVAQVAVGTRTRGSASARDAQRDVLWSSLELLLKYVQSLCDASPEHAAALIETAGMVVAIPPTHGKDVLEVRQQQPGTVALSAYVALLTAGKGSKKTSFNWRYTLDDGQTWIQPLSTPVGNIVIKGLTPMTTVGFCVSVSDSDGVGPWSQIVRFLVR